MGAAAHLSTWQLLAATALLAAAMTLLVQQLSARRGRAVFMVDFVAGKPPASWSHTRAHIEKSAYTSGFFSQDTIDFQRKVLYASGLGNATNAPDWLHTFPQDTSIARAREEFELLTLPAIRELLEKTGVKPSQIGVLVVNSSVFCPTPSLAALLMHRLQLDRRTIHFNLGGMGCAASPIAIDCASQALLARPNTYALVVSAEILTQSVYKGTQRSMLVPNVLFRSGCAAILLSNKRSEARRAKYELLHLVRTAVMGEEAAHTAAVEMEDSEGIKGIKLSKELPRIAAGALRVNLSELGPKVLPWSEKLRFAANWAQRRLLRQSHVEPRQPNLMKAAEHICIHTGGKAVIDGIRNVLGLSDAYVEPSRASLYRFGNTSSSSLWYVLSYIEHFKGLRRGERVLQLAFGSGFKCNSVVWRANRTFKSAHPAWEGFSLEEMAADLKVMEAQLKQLLVEMASKGADKSPKLAAVRSIAMGDVRNASRDQQVGAAERD